MMSAAAGRPGALCASRGIRAPLLPARRPVTRGTKMAVNAFKNAEKDQKAKIEPAAEAPPAAKQNGTSDGAPAAAAPLPSTPAAADEMAHLKAALAAAKKAQAQYSTFSQAQVDKIFKAAALAANSARIPLAKMAVEETRMGVLEDKVTKNHFASEFVYNKYKHTKTCGVIEVDAAGGVTKVAEPVGVIAGIVPTTNPTSTAIFKALLTLKTRNALILCPHPRASKCTVAAARIVRDAAEAAGCPPGVISWIENPSLPITSAVMSAPEVSLVLATGGPSMVRAAYSSGHPALGVGAGNTPAVIDETANIQTAVSSILLSKTFDNGVICASEQSVVVVDEVYEQVKAEFIRRGAYFLTEEEKGKVRSKIFINGRLNADIVGQSAQKLAKLFGIEVPYWTKVIIGEVDRVGKDEPLSEEKLCPVLAMYRSADFPAAVVTADTLVNLFGPGHTSVLHTNPRNRDHIQYFNTAIKTVRVLVNTPASHGAIGDLYNFHLNPSLTLGCGSWGSTSVSTNVGPEHLLNIKNGIERRENMLWFRVPPKIYFKGGSLDTGLRDLRGKLRAFIVTDKPLFDMGYVDRVTDVLDSMSVHHQTFYHVPADPDLSCIEAGVREMREFRPDVVIAIGGGSPMDAAKVMWLMYEAPHIEFESLAVRFMDIRKRVYELPAEVGQKSDLVCIPTTSGTGSEVTPFAVVTDDRTGQKYPLADYALTPTMAIVDTHLVLDMPQRLTAYGGLDTLTHALESYVSIFSTPYTQGLSKEATALIIKYLPRAYNEGSKDYEAREQVHSAATIAGMAFGNAFLGICHSLAHKVGAQFHVAHGLANAALISHVIRYNATDRPPKQAAFPQYEYPRGKERYAELADMLGLGGPGMRPREKVRALILAVEELKAKCAVPATLKEIIGADKEGEFFAALDEMAENAFDDQCTGANPRYPRIAELRQILIDAWGTPIAETLTVEAGMGATRVPMD
ncbi:bifunctional acetaldehyde-alcohol dehydrogenase [Micractinium conductrix]|uniref:alcohol dehydrogenase n=1 Tax=Micractinium conductrix TaxID=554055 RepID=A0A2P6V5Z5_9CHLO|nr:bifunctional acetaldehyde-alcohol dehydrogenase [Micractinium conductrix]|eukprot:PSC69509.1 bifunctional acetaldehyde-alcohol dehydrogenase [Micractinium conductrix]